MVHNRGQRCGDIELETFLADTVGPIHLVMDLRKYVNIVLVIVTVPLLLFRLCLLLLLPLTTFNVILCDFYFWRLIWKRPLFAVSGVDHGQHNQD